MTARLFTWFSFVGMAAAIALLDRITQGELAFTMLLVPLVGIFAWSEGTASGCILSAAATAYWTSSDLSFGKLTGGDLIPYVNAGLRFCVLGFSAYVVAHLRQHLETSIALRVKDHGTGLLNEVGLSERVTAELARAVRRQRPVSAAVLKIGGAKKAAHDIGDDETDAVIKPLADELLKQVRRCDFAARLSGDDFVAILPETDSLGAHGFTNRASVRLSAAAEGAGISLSVVTVSWAKPEFDTVSFLKVIENIRALEASGHIDA